MNHPISEKYHQSRDVNKLTEEGSKYCLVVPATISKATTVRIMRNSPTFCLKRPNFWEKPKKGQITNRPTL